MTPQERQLVDQLIERLSQVEGNPRDAEAEAAIKEGLIRAPHAVYALVQTVLVQDEALRRADARIRELSGGAEEPASGGFLDTMRQALSGRSANTSVPSVSTTRDQDPRWNSGPAAAAGAPMAGGSFLGTAAASAAGVIGGALLLNSISSMFTRGGTAFAGTSPWSPLGDDSAHGGKLSQDAGINEIGSAARDDAKSAGLFNDHDNDDSATQDDSADFVDEFEGDPAGDFNGDFGGGEDV
ncbi:MAG TPA: DUF2076 domain-containing protein [Pseudolabrys sp.]|nr:DUF2076 domain-containing protein [Pseudolabrys sp.]